MSVTALESYPMNSKSRGYCFITTLSFGDQSPPFSASLSSLVVGYRSAFEELGFSPNMIEEQPDSNSRNVTTALRELANKDHTDCDCVVVVIICQHGYNLSPPMNVIPSTSSVHRQADLPSSPLQDLLQLSDVFAVFRSDRCPQLRGKPKLFFIHTPRDPPPTNRWSHRVFGGGCVPVADWVARSRCPEVNLGWDYCIVYAPLPFLSGNYVPHPGQELIRALRSEDRRSAEISRLLIRFKSSVSASKSSELIMPKVFSSLTKQLVFT